MARIIKTFALDVPKDCVVMGMVDDGETIWLMKKNGEATGSIKIPTGQWKILSVENNTVHLLPDNEEVALRDGWITKY